MAWLPPCFPFACSRLFNSLCEVERHGTFASIRFRLQCGCGADAAETRFAHLSGTPADSPSMGPPRRTVACGHGRSSTAASRSTGARSRSTSVSAHQEPLRSRSPTWVAGQIGRCQAPSLKGGKEHQCEFPRCKGLVENDRPRNRCHPATSSAAVADSPRGALPRLTAPPALRSLLIRAATGELRPPGRGESARPDLDTQTLPPPVPPCPPTN
jgi:hypothetical protein